MGTKKTILAVDDEAHILELLKFNLETNGYAVVACESGEDALLNLESHNIDAVVLDLMLPGIDGLEVLRRIRASGAHKSLPVVILTAKGDEIDKVLGLEMGADDYLAKPFGVRELMARLKAVMRRSEPSSESAPEILSFGGFKMDENKRSVSKNGEPLELTFKEYELLMLLVKNEGKVFTREKLLETIWGYDYIGETRTVDVHIRQLRKKIEEDDANPGYIKTVRGVGYKFAP